MFSVATTTALLFVVFLMVLGVTIWIDSKKTYILPPKLNHQDGGQEATEENASAEFKANPKNGDLVAKVSANYPGKGSAWAALGYEFDNQDSDEKKIIVELNFKYRINLDTDNDQSPVCAKIETILNGNPVTIVEKRLSAPVGEQAANSDEFLSAKQRHATLLKPGEKFTACLKISLQAEAGSDGKSSGEIVANLSEIYYRPELTPM